MSRSRANLKRSRKARGSGVSQWAASVVKKATPKIAQSLIEAAESLSEPGSLPYSKSASQFPGEDEDESLAAMLLRLLRTPDTGESSGSPDSATLGGVRSENPSVG